MTTFESVVEVIEQRYKNGERDFGVKGFNNSEVIDLYEEVVDHFKVKGTPMELNFAVDTDEEGVVMELGIETIKRMHQSGFGNDEWSFNDKMHFYYGMLASRQSDENKRFLHVKFIQEEV